MAAPNLKAPTTITGKTALYAVTTSTAAALSNASSSGKVLKVSGIRAANVTSSNATIEVSVYRSTTDRYLVKGALVEGSGSLVIQNRNEYLYLEEGDDLRAKASASTTLELVIAYEEIS